MKKEKTKIRRLGHEEPLPWKMLFHADPSRSEVKKYSDRGEVWVLQRGQEIVGAMVLMKTRVDVLEIMNIAVDPELRGKGLGTALLRKAKQRAREVKATSLHVGTGNNSFRQLQFYQRFGFRICGIDRDFFIGRYRKQYTNAGVPLLDMVRMEIRLSRSKSA